MTNKTKKMSHLKTRKSYDYFFSKVGQFCLLFALVILIVVFFDLTKSGYSRLNYFFLSNFPAPYPNEAGILSAWVGSIVVIITTALFAIPVGIAAGVYLEEYAAKNIITKTLELCILNLASIPSITFGLLALGLFVYRFGLGPSILTAGLTLALLILPLVIVTTREAIKTVPVSVREAAYALGATRWQVTRDHVVPYSAGGILTGVIISLSRAMGETAPLVTIGALTFIAFLPNSPFIPEFPFISFSWLNNPFTVLPIQMFNWTSRPQQDFHQNAAAAGLILLILTLTMNTIAIGLRIYLRKKVRW